MKKLKIGVIKEGKTPPDRRVPLSPVQCRQIQNDYPEVDLVVQTSDIRSFTDQEYLDEGVTIVEDVSDCDVLIGVKEVPISNLIADKTYFYFSHTIKEQPYNRDLLLTMMEKNIRMVDYETLTNSKGIRLIGFGRYAGIVGAYNGILAYGQRYGAYDLKPAWKCHDRKELEEELRKVSLPPVKIILTGRGRVARGAMEILEALKIEKVEVDDFLNKEFDHPVFVQLTVADYYRRKDGAESNIAEIFDDPSGYDSNFMRFAQAADIYISGHYWDSRAPFIFSREDARSEEFNLKVVADISCDIDGPVASTLRPSTIDDPIYGYDPKAESEVDFKEEGAITVMAVDNLPCELPRDASEDFGNEFINKILPALVGEDSDRIIGRATITENGVLTEEYSYLQNYVDGK